MKHYIIPVFIPHYGCRHACVFCNQQKITGRDTPITPEEVTHIIKEHLTRITEERHIEVAFYGGSFTALTISTQRDLLTPAYHALQEGKIHAIRLSTRPDCITDTIIDHLKEFRVSIIELGVQSLDNQVLKTSARGHTSAHVIEAVVLIKKRGIQCGIQIMPGLPGEDWKSLITTACGVVALAPDFVRVYPTIVISHTKLAEMYYDGRYIPLSLSQGILYAAFLKLLFAQHNILVIRTGLQATTDLNSSDIVLAGPYHPAFGEMVDSYLFYVMLAHAVESIPLKQDGTFLIHHHPRDTSKLRGMSNSNIEKLKNMYNINHLILKADGLHIDEIIIEYRNICYVINKNMLLYV